MWSMSAATTSVGPPSVRSSSVHATMQIEARTSVASSPGALTDRTGEVPVDLDVDLLVRSGSGSVYR